MLYVLTFFVKRLSEENKTEQNWPSVSLPLIFFYVETVLGCTGSTSKIIGQRTDKMSHRDESRATWRQNASNALMKVTIISQSTEKNLNSGKAY